VPIGALCVKATADLLQPGEHASTFGGNPLACRAALTVAEELSRRNLPAHVAAMGELLQQQLAALAARHPSLAEGARGWGLLQGLVLRSDGPAAIDVVKAAMAEGLLLVPAGSNVVRFVPPLTIKRRHIRIAIKRLEKALLACQAQTPSAT
jgi:acetylornithine aminotransferase